MVVKSLPISWVISLVLAGIVQVGRVAGAEVLKEAVKLSVRAVKSIMQI